MQSSESALLSAFGVPVQSLAKAILDVKGDYDPEDDLVLQVQARPNDIEGFNLQVRARAWLGHAQCVRRCVSGSAGPAGHQPGVPIGECWAHAGRPEAQGSKKACRWHLAGALHLVGSQS